MSCLGEEPVGGTIRLSKGWLSLDSSGKVGSNLTKDRRIAARFMISPAWGTMSSALCLLWLLTSCSPDPQNADSARPGSTTDHPSTSIRTTDEAGWVALDSLAEFRPQQALTDLELLIEASQRELARTIGQTDSPASAAIDREVAPTFSQAARIMALAQLDQGPEWEGIEERLLLQLKAHIDHQGRQPGLVDKVREEWNQRFELGDQEYRRLIELTWRNLTHSGAALAPDQRDELDRVERELSQLTRRFEQHRSYNIADFELHTVRADRLIGLPGPLRHRALNDARDRGHSGGWSFTLYPGSLRGLLEHSRDRELRKQVYQAWQHRTSLARSIFSRDTPELVRRILALRAEKAALLGHASYLDAQLADSSLADPDRLEAILEAIDSAARPRALEQLERIESLLQADGHAGSPQPWDRWHYVGRDEAISRQEDADLAREYLTLDSVRDGAFLLAERLWGLEFLERGDLPRWHPDVKAFSVIDRARGGRTLGYLYLDLIRREGKGRGAWMSILRPAIPSADENTLPAVANLADFDPGPPGQPVLLTPDQTRSVFHELGHALAELFSKTRFTALSASQAAPDVVEFPALLMERFALQPEMLDLYARHYRHDTPMPAPLRASVSRQTSQTSALETLEQLAAIRVDLAWHGRAAGQVMDPGALEAEVISIMALPGMLSPRHYLDGYRALVSGERAGQQYRSLWSEVLAADVFARFRDRGLFDRELAAALRDQVLAPANSIDPLESITSFLGRPVQADALIAERALGGL